MFSHIMVGSNDLERSKRFYDALFGKEAKSDEKGRLSYGRRGAVYMVTPPIDGQPATHGNGSTIGFVFDTPEEVDAWLSGAPRAAVDRGTAGIATAFGTCNWPTGDPDGNKLCDTTPGMTWRCLEYVPWWPALGLRHCVGRWTHD